MSGFVVLDLVSTVLCYAFSALTLLVGHQKEHPAFKRSRSSCSNSSSSRSSSSSVLSD